MTPFAIDYTVWVFVCAMAVLQAAAAWSGLAGLLFFRAWPTASLRVSLLLFAAAHGWYFASARRNHPDTGLGLDGPTQAQWFAVATGTALLLTLLMSSALNHRWANGRHTGNGREDGFERLRHTTFLLAFMDSVTSLFRGMPSEEKR